MKYRQLKHLLTIVGAVVTLTGLSLSVTAQRPSMYWGGVGSIQASTPDGVCLGMSMNGEFSHTESTGISVYHGNRPTEQCVWINSWYQGNDDGEVYYGTAIFYGDSACQAGFSSGGGGCQQECGNGQGTNGGSCTVPEVQHTECTSVGNPIDVLEGEKYRQENILSVGSVFPIELQYLYNSHAGMERTFHGFRPGVNDTDTYIAATVPTMNSTDIYLAEGDDFIFGRDFQQAHGNSNRYWRHTYEDFLNENGTEYTWQRSNGNDVVFHGVGRSQAYPQYTIETQTNGWKISSTSNSLEHYFDDEGRLTQITDLRSGQSHTVTYLSNGVDIDQITHSLGGHIKFTYASNDIDPQNVSQHALIKAQYPTSIEDHTGLTVDLEWSGTFLGRFQRYFLISSISHPYTNTPAGKREFEYANTTFPASITAIYDQENANVNSRELYATFTYDTQGRAVYSALANGVEAISVEYTSDTTRRVTNSLNKVTQYQLAASNGVTRLVSITGEPTTNCLLSDTSMTYDNDGNVTSRIKNGVVTTYNYNPRGLETSRTEASGTPEARTIQTEWHAQFNVPTKITEPDRVTDFTYDSNGRLLSRNVAEPVQN